VGEIKNKIPPHQKTEIEHPDLPPASSPSNSWQHIHRTIEDELQKEIRARYCTLDENLEN